MTTTQTIINKYHDTIAEEVNVKKVTALPEDFAITKSYSPLGKELSADFGKDTGQIIGQAKAGKVVDNGDGTITIANQRTLQPHQYEVRYSWLDEFRQTVEEGVIVSLDMGLTDELIAEGVARELSRQLNQMRKDADYQIDDRVTCLYATDDDYLQSVITTHSGFLKQEALLLDIQSGTQLGDITTPFNHEDATVSLTLIR